MKVYNLNGMLQGQNLLAQGGEEFNDDGYDFLALLQAKYVNPHKLLLHILKHVEWEEGKLIERYMVGSYRHAVTIVCSSHARSKAEFANGTFSYFAYCELLQPNGVWIQEGNNVVPILPDGRFLMVVERRPVLERYEHPHIVELIESGRSFDIGLSGALEFPGGAYDPGESFTTGCLRELREETEVSEQRAKLIRRIPHIYPFGADLVLRMLFNVVYLSGLSFSDYVENDGGLRVVALTEKEVWHNIRNGVISSAQSALTGWALYQEVKRAREDGTFDHLVETGYLALDEVQIVKPK